MSEVWSTGLPETIRVAAFDITINRWTGHQARASARWGEFSAIEQCISIQVDMPTYMKLIDTVLHEITHAIFWAYGIEDEDKEERIVGTMGTAWAQIWRDNPLLLKWLSDVLKT